MIDDSEVNKNNSISRLLQAPSTLAVQISGGPDIAKYLVQTYDPTAYTVTIKIINNTELNDLRKIICLRKT